MDFLESHRNEPYKVLMFNRNNEIWNIFILREDMYNNLPYFYTIIITQNNVPRGNNRCDFEITTTHVCHIINTKKEPFFSKETNYFTLPSGNKENNSGRAAGA